MVGVGANPAAVLVLVVLLSLLLFVSRKLGRFAMTRKTETNSKSCRVKRLIDKLVLLPSFFETIWAVGASVVATIVLPPINPCRVQ